MRKQHLPPPLQPFTPFRLSSLATPSSHTTATTTTATDNSLAQLFISSQSIDMPSLGLGNEALDDIAGIMDDICFTNSVIPLSNVVVGGGGGELPVWHASSETDVEQIDMMLNYRTKKCLYYSQGSCRSQRCFDYHYQTQRRRSPVSPSGYLAYCDVPCKHMSNPAQCARKDSCAYCHSVDELRYHPAIFKTQLCNGHDCRGPACHFAHPGESTRPWAVERYSLGSAAAAAICWPPAPPLSRGHLRGSLLDRNSSENSVNCSDSSERFKIVKCPNLGQVHDRKLCPFYHNFRDRRRFPVTYEAEQCPRHFDIDTSVISCDRGDECDKCHSRIELLYHPSIFKQRFCATWPNVASCARGHNCAFAHHRDEVNGKMFTEEQETVRDVDFFVNHFKTLWCPYGVQHDWHRCYYAHTYQDCRRSPALEYGSEPCPHWGRSKAWTEYGSRCPNGHRCPYSHGSKEQLYHPSYYKTMPCCDWKSRGRCPRGELCAFYHDPSERRQATRLASLDYSRPLSTGEELCHHQPNFWRPPLFSADEGSSESRGSSSSRARAYTASTDSDTSSRTMTVRSEWSTEKERKSTLGGDTSSVVTTAPGSTELHPRPFPAHLKIPTIILSPSIREGSGMPHFLTSPMESIPCGGPGDSNARSVVSSAREPVGFIDLSSSIFCAATGDDIAAPSLASVNYGESNLERLVNDMRHGMPVTSNSPSAAGMTLNGKYECEQLTTEPTAAPSLDNNTHPMPPIGAWREAAEVQLDILLAGDAESFSNSSMAIIFDSFSCH